jgi:hypothetical protein
LKFLHRGVQVLEVLEGSTLRAPATLMVEMGDDGYLKLGFMEDDKKNKKTLRKGSEVDVHAVEELR